jgi:adenylosuccinate synthase
VLSGLPHVQICTAYQVGGEAFDDVPPHQSLFHKATPVYQRLPGWAEDLTAARRFGDLPPAARAYVGRIAELAQIPVRHVSVGPDREQTIEVVNVTRQRRPA